jgi:hypothetical protein
MVSANRTALEMKMPFQPKNLQGVRYALLHRGEVDREGAGFEWRNVRR